MGGGKKSMIEMTLDPEEAAEFFRGLAQDLEEGSLRVDRAVISLEGFKSIALTLEKTGEGLRLAAAVKVPEPGADPARPGYATLKRWMKKEFKAIRKALDKGRLPDPDLAASFVSDSLRMVACPDKGDEFYAAYKAKALEFGEAVQAGDLARAQAAAADLRAQKRDCHDRHKKKAEA